MGAKIVHQDCIEALRAMPENSIDACVCDPPYGLSKEPDVAEVLRHWLAGDKYEHGFSGFMGKRWDSFVPGPEYWREIYRVLKPGAHLLVFAGTRTADLMSLAIRFAGFENRDTISSEGSLRWYHGQGFPKSLDVGKALDKAAGAKREVVGLRPDAAKLNKSVQEAPGGWVTGQRHPELTAPSTDAAKTWDGFGTALKPAWEPVLVFRKPLVGTVAQNVTEHGTGALNIDGCRIHSGPSNGGTISGGTALGQGSGWNAHNNRTTEIDRTMAAGRWPANLVLCHHLDCEVKIGEEEPFEEIWECVEGCPIRQLDEQTGILKSGERRSGTPNGSIGYHGGGSATPAPRYATDAGGASRFFYTSKASGSEKNQGTEELFWRKEGEGFIAVDRETWEALPEKQRAQGNIHPTVKPLKLMRWLARLVGGQPESTILDPFCGSGTTLIAGMLEGFNVIGIDQDEGYCKIAKARLTWWEKQENEDAA